MPRSLRTVSRCPLPLLHTEMQTHCPGTLGIPLPALRCSSWCHYPCCAPGVRRVLTHGTSIAFCRVITTLWALMSYHQIHITLLMQNPEHRNTEETTLSDAAMKQIRGGRKDRESPRESLTSEQSEMYHLQGDRPDCSMGHSPSLPHPLQCNTGSFHSGGAVVSSGSGAFDTPTSTPS